MRRRSAPTLSFRGFVVLADIIFALAAGFMLLHPLQPVAQRAPAPPDPPRPDASALEERLNSLLPKLRDGANDLDSLEQRLQESLAKASKSGAPVR
jgi:hypothetical protein